MIREFFRAAGGRTMHQLFIAGAWIDAGAAPERAVTNPATLARLDAVADCGADQIARAVAAARAALPAWAGMSGEARRERLAPIGARIRRQEREIAELSSRESGRPLCEARDGVAAAAAIFERCAAAGDPGSPEAAAAPGVVAALVPGNCPLPVLAAAVAPALAAGHVLVCKPPATTPLAVLKLAASFEELPAGVVNVITGDGQTGLSLGAHPGVAAVTFTGSAAGARRIEELARGKRLALEARAVRSIIVCRDADLEQSVPAVAWARLANTGQNTASHVYVERPIVREFIDRMHPCIGLLDVDDPARAATDLGPLISLDAARRVEDQVGRTLRAGARLILGGRRFRPSGLPGHFFQQTLLTDVPPGAVPAREEILGPVLTITPVADLREALALAAGSMTSIHAGDAEGVCRMLGDAAGGPFLINDPAEGALGPLSATAHPAVRRLLGPRIESGADERIRYAARLERKSWWFPYAERAPGA